MKLIKFIAATALVASTSLVSGGQASSAAGLTQDIARACPDWPFCRDIEIADQALDMQQINAEVVRKAV